MIEWAYGVTTIPERKNDLLIRTLESLYNAGFTTPRLFIDGCNDIEVYNDITLPITMRYPRCNTFGNYILSLYELYFRQPYADYYILFQDDIITYKNLRYFLEQDEFPKNSYLNLYTAKINSRRTRRDIINGGWFLPRIRGHGATSLLFTNSVLRSLLRHKRLMWHAQTERNWECVDGCINLSLYRMGIMEYIHIPSLIQHVGVNSSMGHGGNRVADMFIAPEYDALALLKG